MPPLILTQLLAVVVAAPALARPRQACGRCRGGSGGGGGALGLLLFLLLLLLGVLLLLGLLVCAMGQVWGRAGWKTHRYTQ
jgi:hypothetical protein